MTPAQDHPERGRRGGVRVPALAQIANHPAAWWQRGAVAMTVIGLGAQLWWAEYAWVEEPERCTLNPGIECELLLGDEWETAEDAFFPLPQETEEETPPAQE